MRYIGSKKNLIPDIEELLNKHLTGNEETFLDLFGGTNIVGKHFKRKFVVYSNDLLYFSYINAKSTIENNKELDFKKLKKIGINDPIDFLNKKDVNGEQVGYYEKAYTPSGDAMYLTTKNGKKLDLIRAQIEAWKKRDLLTSYEYSYLLSCLIEAIPYVSNITGTYGAYLKKWDKRALKDLYLTYMPIIDNFKPNKAFNEDAISLAKTLDTDIVYVDTPYNSRQYASNYHLLENVARHNKPKLKGKTKIFDWSSLKSKFAMKREALCAMEELIANISAQHVIVSYSTDGIISEKELLQLLKKYSIDRKIDVKKIPYKRYSSKQTNTSNQVYELLIYLSRDENKHIINNDNVKISSSLNNKNNTTRTWNPIDKNKLIKSPLNYIGGKYKLLPQILPLFPDNINNFIDLFSGGGNVAVNVSANFYIMNDINSRIIEMFEYFYKKNPDVLIQKIEDTITKFKLSKTNQESYLKFRDYYNQNPNPLNLYVLVSYSYNYQIRFNNSLKFNNPFGKNRSCFSQNMKHNLKKFVNELNNKDVIFSNRNFTDFDFEQLSSKDLVYLDPPYFITTGNYNDGNRGFIDWKKTQEEQLYRILKYLSEKKIRFALSNVISHKGVENTILKKFLSEEKLNVYHLNFNYKNSSYNTTHLDSDEVLITNYDPQTGHISNK